MWGLKHTQSGKPYLRRTHNGESKIAGFVLESGGSPGGNTAAEGTVRSQVQPAALGTLRKQPLGQGGDVWDHKTPRGPAEGLECMCACVCVCVCVRARMHARATWRCWTLLGTHLSLREGRREPERAGSGGLGSEGASPPPVITGENDSGRNTVSKLKGKRRSEAGSQRSWLPAALGMMRR